MILVIGGTGMTGRPAVKRLVARGESVRVVTRDVKTARGVPELAGAEIVAGDSADPDTLGGAFDGVVSMYLVPPTMPGWDMVQTAIIRLARDRGVEHVVRISALGTNEHAASMSLRFHWYGERELEESGMRYTHIRANSFFQNTLFDAPTIRSENAFYSAVGALRFAKVDARDVGEVVAAVLTDPAEVNGQYTLTGSEALSYADMAAVMSRVLGRRIWYVDLPVDEWARRLVAEGFPLWLADEFAAIYGLGFDDPTVVEATTGTVLSLLGRPPRRFEDFVDEYRDQFESLVSSSDEGRRG